MNVCWISFFHVSDTKWQEAPASQPCMQNRLVFYCFLSPSVNIETANTYLLFSAIEQQHNGSTVESNTNL